MDLQKELKLKYNVTLIKWILFCGLLLGNLLLLAPNEDLLFIIIWEVSLNCLAVVSFIALSFLPRLYYIFNKDGISYQNYKGKEYIFISWDKIVDISYVKFLGLIPDGLEIKWREGASIRNMTLVLSIKQVRELYNSNSFVYEFINNSAV